MTVTFGLRSSFAVNPVIRELQAHGVQVTALHSALDTVAVQ